MTKDEIENYLKLRELKYIKAADNIWHMSFRNLIVNYQRHFEIFLILLDEWLYLRVPLLSVDNQNCWPYLNEYLLCLNYTLFLAKVALQGRQVLFMTELPVRCSMADLDDAITAVSTYVRAYYLDIETMATSANVATLVHTALQSVTEEKEQAEQQNIPQIIFNEV